MLEELNSMDVWDVAAEDLSEFDLAADKRAAIEALIAEDEENEEGEEKK